MTETLEKTLKNHSTEGELYDRLEDDEVRCYACGHLCLIKDGRSGVCNVRFNEGGELKVPYEYVGPLQLDPIERKPFFHANPGSDVLSFGMEGCDFQCGYCHNWVSSQALRDPEAGADILEISADEIVEKALDNNVSTILSSFNEPLITGEWAVEVFEKAQQEDLFTGFISNGNATDRALDYLVPNLDVYKVDLKTFQDENYRELGGTLQNVLDTIIELSKRDIHMEVVTLVVPDFNDSERELRDIAQFLSGVSEDIPWHLYGFHNDYKMQDRDHTNHKTLMRAAEIGYEEGLNYVYAGNLPGMVGEYEHTFCPECDTRLIERYGYRIREQRIDTDGNCPNCGTSIPGVWSTEQVNGESPDPGLTGPDPIHPAPNDDELKINVQDSLEDQSIQTDQLNKAIVSRRSGNGKG